MMRLALLIGFLLCAPSSALAGERVSLPGIGLSLTIPDGWEQAVAEPAFGLAPRSMVEREANRRRAAASPHPFVAMRQPGAKHMFTVSIKALLVDRTAMEVLARLHRVAGERLVEIDVLDAPHTVRISGFPAAHIRFAYVMEQDGVVNRGISEHWAVVRGGYYFAFSAGYSRDTPPEVRAAIHAAVASARLD